jgi:hypothetical protein
VNVWPCCERNSFTRSQGSQALPLYTVIIGVLQ